MEKSRLRCVVIGGSAGSLKVILGLLPALTIPLKVSLIVILHRLNNSDSSLMLLLASKTAIPVREIEDKEFLQPGTIYIAPADYHLLIEKEDQFSLDGSEKVWFSRPSIDVTFQSAAAVYGPRLMGILLSGANQDGAEGLVSIKEAGGTTVIQDPSIAENGVMPQAALSKMRPDYILQDKNIGPMINEWSDLLIS